MRTEKERNNDFKKVREEIEELKKDMEKEIQKLKKYEEKNSKRG